MEKKVAILGAGISGLSTAFQLRELNPNIDFTIFERNPDLEGGRACTSVKQCDEKLNQCLFFDPGASYISFDNQEQQDLIYEKLFKKDHPDIFLKDLEEIKKPIFTLNKDGVIEKTEKKTLNLSYKKGIHQLTNKLGHNILDKIRFNSEILSLLKDQNSKRWVIHYRNVKDNISHSEHFDVIINALHPLALQSILANNIIEGNQTDKLIQEENLNKAITSLKGMNFKQAISICLDYQIPKSLLGDHLKEDLTEFFSIVNPDYTHDILQINVENEKPGHIPDLRNDSQFDYIHLGLTIQMSQKWSDIYMNKPDEEIINEVILKLIKIFQNKDNKNFFNGALPENAEKIFKSKENIWFSQVSKWEYAYHAQQVDLNKCVENPKQEGLYFGGDILYPKASILNAIESGINIAKQVNEVY